MPTYVYKTAHGQDGCEVCREGFGVFQQLRGEPFDSCPECRAAVFRVIQPVTIGAMDPRLDDGPMYMSQLVEPGDPNPRANPQNYVSGPHSWRRKVDEAQRNGVRLMTNAEIAEERSPREIKRAEREER